MFDLAEKSEVPMNPAPLSNRVLQSGSFPVCFSRIATSHRPKIHRQTLHPTRTLLLRWDHILLAILRCTLVTHHRRTCYCPTPTSDDFRHQRAGPGFLIDRRPRRVDKKYTSQNSAKTRRCHRYQALTIGGRTSSCRRRRLPYAKQVPTCLAR